MRHAFAIEVRFVVRLGVVKISAALDGHRAAAVRHRAVRAASTTAAGHRLTSVVARLATFAALTATHLRALLF